MELYDQVKRCAEHVERYKTLRRRIGEQNTKATLIEPIIAALGWDVLDPEEVHREYRRRASENPVDYALLLVRTARLFIEAKGLGENLDDPRWANQTISYATAAGVQWVALTDGATWKIYNAHAPVPIEQKMFREVRVDSDADASFEVLTLLSKENLRDNRIEELWNGFFVDRQVRESLQELFTADDPPRDLVSLVAKRVPRLNRSEVRASLVRAEATFDFPSEVSLAPAGVRSNKAPERESRANAREAKTHTEAHPRVSPAERRTKLRDVVESGRLRVGDTLDAKHLESRHTAVVEDGGMINYQGSKYDSPSGAGGAAKVVQFGPEVPDSVKATDGWTFWHATDTLTGEHVSLKELRRRVAATD